jgi:hypothetical protein
MNTSIEVLSLRRLQDHTLPTARYLDKSDPHEILRRGFIEEVHELCVELEGDDTSKISGEMGDLLWYAAEFTRHMPDELYGEEGDIPLDVLHNMAGPSTDIEIVARERTGAEDVSQGDILTVAAFRLLDSMQPTDDTLWITPPGRVNSAVALNQMLFILGNIAQERGITLSSSAYQTLEKLRTRTRNTNVLERANNDPEAQDNYVQLLQARMAQRAIQGAITPDAQAS